MRRDFTELKNIGAVANLDKFCIVSVVENPDDKQKYIHLKVGKGRMLVNVQQTDELIRALRTGQTELRRLKKSGND